MAAARQGVRRLMRDFVHECLYARAGYFSSPAERVHHPAAPVRFTALIGEAEWRQTQTALVEESSAGFLTPVEYFNPWYARALGRYIVGDHLRHIARVGRTHPGAPPPPLRIVEMGGGNGTCAAAILGLLRDDFPELFETCSYELVEISQTMAERQSARLRENGVDGERYAVHNLSAIDWARRQGGQRDRPTESPAGQRQPGGDGVEPCYILGLELLDNLPHDLLRWTPRGLEQAVVVELSGEPLQTGTQTAGAAVAVGACAREQQWEPLTDEALQWAVKLLELDTRAAWRAAALSRARSHPGLSMLRPARLAAAWLSAATAASPSLWVPTSAALLLDGLLRSEPAHRLILADFDWLPPQPGGALLAPVVQSRTGAHTLDRGGRVLEASDGECDVFYPTDFSSLAGLYTALGGARARTIKTRDFMREHAELECTETRSGYNPLLEDFSNTALLIARADHPEDRRRTPLGTVTSSSSRG